MKNWVVGIAIAALAIQSGLMEYRMNTLAKTEESLLEIAGYHNSLLHCLVPQLHHVTEVEQ